MNKVKGFLSRRWFLLSWLLAFAAVLSVAGVQFNSSQMQGPEKAQFTLVKSGEQEAVVTLGSVAEAAGSVDFTFDGVDDNVQFQLALNALPAGPNGGGRLVVVSSTQINFAALATVTRALDNVTIECAGRGSYFVGDGVTAPFTAGGNNWKLVNMRVNVTTAVQLAAMAATTQWRWTNLTTTDGFFEERTDNLTTGTSWNIPAGRGATLVVAANDASAAEKAQADYVCDGVADDVEIQAAFTAITATGG